jgi:hypothetical protein
MNGTETGFPFTTWVAHGFTNAMVFGWPKASVGEIAGSLRHRGNHPRERNPVALVFLLHIGEEEGLVFLDGAAQRAAKLIEIELFGGRGEEAAGIQVGIAEELENASVELVGARFRGHQNSRAAARPPFRRIVVSEDLEFLDGIDRRQNRNGAGSEFVVIVAVQQPIGAVGARSPTESEKEPRADASLLGPPLKKLLGLVSCVVPGVSVASWTKSRPFKGRSATCWLVITWPRVASAVCTATGVAETSTLVCTVEGESLKSSSRCSSTCSRMSCAMAS